MQDRDIPKTQFYSMLLAMAGSLAVFVAMAVDVFDITVTPPFWRISCIFYMLAWLLLFNGRKGKP